VGGLVSRLLCVVFVLRAFFFIFFFFFELCNFRTARLPQFDAPQNDLSPPPFFLWWSGMMFDLVLPAPVLSPSLLQLPQSEAVPAALLDDPPFLKGDRSSSCDTHALGS